MSVTNAKLAIHNVPIDIPPWPENLGPKIPLTKIRSTEPPKFKELRKGTVNKGPRQRWFEEKILVPIAMETRSSLIPWRFRTPNGECWQLDQGCVGYAVANGVLVTPEDPERVLDYVELTGSADTVETYDSDASNELERRKRLGRITSRLEQEKFSKTIRQNYGGKCAITGCSTATALQAAHIRTLDAADDNDAGNGVLLRADIHALFDAFLITFTPDGHGIEVSPKLTDPSYKFLRSKEMKVTFPKGGGPSRKNIEYHRGRFHKQKES